jgi:HAD superfamily hydrolase (TIGR01490 family)
MNVMNLASFFDLDGTLIKGYLMTNFAKHLVLKGLFSKKKFNEIEHWLNLFQNKQVINGQIETNVPVIYANGIKNQKVQEVKQEAKSFVEEVITNSLYPYTMTLVNIMKQYGMTIGISGAPIEVVSCLGEHFHFNFSYGTEVEAIKGFYSGVLKRNLVIQESKVTVMENVISENNINLKKSFGFGDTEQDISFLSKVGNPIALNPNQKLFSIAQQKKWIILHWKDDVINQVKKLIEKKKVVKRDYVYFSEK